jgi:hypothetical protein
MSTEFGNRFGRLVVNFPFGIVRESNIWAQESSGEKRISPSEGPALIRLGVVG